MNQTIHEVKSKKKNQKAKTFRRFWYGFNNQNLAIEKENGLYKLSFPTLEKRIGVPVIAEVYQQHWPDKILSGQAKQGAADLYEKKANGISCFLFHLSQNELLLLQKLWASMLG